VMPHFMVNKVPAGLVGLIVAAIISAAMSTISSGFNASATVFLVDIYRRYVSPNLSGKQSLRLLIHGHHCLRAAGHADGYRHDRGEKCAGHLVDALGDIRGGNAGAVSAGYYLALDPQCRSTHRYHYRGIGNCLDDVFGPLSRGVCGLTQPISPEHEWFHFPIVQIVGKTTFQM